MTTEIRPDLSEVIREAIQDHPWAAVDALTPIAAHDPEFVAYFATGGADDNLEEAIALRALLNSPRGIEGLKDALEAIINAPAPAQEGPLGQRFIDLRVCGHGDAGMHVELCRCGEAAPAAFVLGDGFTTCVSCGRQRNHVTEEITPPTENVLAQGE